MDVRPTGGRSGGQLKVTVVACAIVTLTVLVGTPIAVGKEGLVIDIPIAVVAVVAAVTGFFYLRPKGLDSSPASCIE